MAQEIERKFLVRGSEWRTANPKRISQGYLNRDEQRTVRVRIYGNQAFLTVKGITTGAVRSEFEYEIPLSDAEALLRMCEGPLVEKLRHRILHDGHVWEVDEFLGENGGLVVAEVELQSETESFANPPWLANEVTHDARYYNSNLAANPFTRWEPSADQR